MSARPYIKFYTSDWRGEPALRLCSWEARYLWLEMIFLMNDSGGYLLHGKKAMSEEQLAVILSAPLELVRTCLFELETNGVFSRDRAGKIYSRKMLKAEKRGRYSRDNPEMVGNPNLRKETTKSGMVTPHIVDHYHTKEDRESLNGDSPSRKGDLEAEKKPEPKLPRKVIEIPGWVDGDAWLAYVDMRKKIRKPMTDRAVELAIAKLDQLRSAGHEPKLVLEQSVLNAWQGLFELKPRGDRNGNQHNQQKPSYADKVRAATAGAAAILDRDESAGLPPPTETDGK